MKPDQSVVERIKKLLALSDGNKNEHEREVAMQFAMDLLAKHNLTLSEVKGASLRVDVEEVEGNFRLERWIRSVLDAACTLYYTDFYISFLWDDWRGNYRDTPVFVGTADNIAVTIELASWLIESIRLESNRAYRSAYERRSFRCGAAWRLVERATSMVVAENSASNATTGTSLMVIRNQLERANEEHLASLNLHQTRSRTTYVHAEAYAHGKEYGDQMSLSRRPSEHTGEPARLPQASAR